MELKLTKPYATSEKIQGLWCWHKVRKILEGTFGELDLAYSVVNKASSTNVFSCDVNASMPLVGLNGTIGLASGPSRVGVALDAEIGDTRKGLIFFGVSCVLFPLLPVYYFMRSKQVSQVEDGFNSLDSQLKVLFDDLKNPVVDTDDD